MEGVGGNVPGSRSQYPPRKLSLLKTRPPPTPSSRLNDILLRPVTVSLDPIFKKWSGESYCNADLIYVDV